MRIGGNDVNVLHNLLSSLLWQTGPLVYGTDGRRSKGVALIDSEWLREPEEVQTQIAEYQNLRNFLKSVIYETAATSRGLSVWFLKSSRVSVSVAISWKRYHYGTLLVIAAEARRWQSFQEHAIITRRVQKTSRYSVVMRMRDAQVASSPRTYPDKWINTRQRLTSTSNE